MATRWRTLMPLWLRRLFCAHQYMWWRNVYGDEIFATDGKRSVWRCEKCGRHEYRAALAKREGGG